MSSIYVVVGQQKQRHGPTPNDYRTLIAEGCILLLILFACTFTASLPVTSARFQCPNTDNCVVSCVSQTESDCTANEILVANTSVCGCCLQCVGGSGVGELCSDNESATCGIGLKCVNEECVYDKESCFFTKHIPDPANLILPRCDIDGTYASAQCKGDRSSGRCFCYSRTGTRIFGWQWWRNIATDPDEMMCGCSRRRYELETIDRRINVTLHCKANGDYEGLQCDSGVCWCAHEQTGGILEDTVAVPQDLWQMLPCYNSTIYGDSYLRQCDSVLYAQSLLKTTFAERGATDVRFMGIQCDYDGTHGTYKVEGSNAYCIWRDGKNLSPYQGGSSSVSDMNCYCARDVQIFANEGFSLPLACSSNGNYAMLQDLDGETFCVDQDGYVVSPTFTTAIHQDECRKYAYYLL